MKVLKEEKERIEKDARAAASKAARKTTVTLLFGFCSLVGVFNVAGIAAIFVYLESQTRTRVQELVPVEVQKQSLTKASIELSVSALKDSQRAILKSKNAADEADRALKKTKEVMGKLRTLESSSAGTLSSAIRLVESANKNDGLSLMEKNADWIGKVEQHRHQKCAWRKNKGSSKQRFEARCKRGFFVQALRIGHNRKSGDDYVKEVQCCPG